MSPPNASYYIFIDIYIYRPIYALQTHKQAKRIRFETVIAEMVANKRRTQETSRRSLNRCDAEKHKHRNQRTVSPFSYATRNTQTRRLRLFEKKINLQSELKF